MFKLSCIVLVLSFISPIKPFLYCQSITGVVTYAQQSNWAKIASGLSFLSKEEKDRYINTWGKRANFKERFVLRFNDSLSHYTYLLQDKSEEYNWSYVKEEMQYYKAYKENIIHHKLGLLGKKYYIKDTEPKYKWKIISEIKEVAGYICMRAECYDSSSNKKITAWFTDKILVAVGPEDYGGLPGLILELDINDGTKVLTAEHIDLNTLVTINQPKGKAKTLLYADYRKIVRTYFDDCIKARRNPYWDLPY